MVGGSQKVMSPTAVSACGSAPSMRKLARSHPRQGSPDSRFLFATFLGIPGGRSLVLLQTTAITSCGTGKQGLVQTSNLLQRAVYGTPNSILRKDLSPYPAAVGRSRSSPRTAENGSRFIDPWYGLRRRHETERSPCRGIQMGNRLQCLAPKRAQMRSGFLPAIHTLWLRRRTCWTVRTLVKQQQLRGLLMVGCWHLYQATWWLCGDLQCLSTSASLVSRRAA